MAIGKLHLSANGWRGIIRTMSTKKPSAKAAKAAAAAKRRVPIKKPAASKTVRKASEAPIAPVITAPTADWPAISAAAQALLENLPARQQVFVREYVVDLNGAQAAIRAGYSERTAKEQASRLLTNVNLKAVIELIQKERAQRLDIKADELLLRWKARMEVNPNELTQYRRLCCRHCWGVNFGYQFTPGEFQRAKIIHAERRAELLGKSNQKADIGDFPGIEGDWFDKRKDPNQDCPECFGEGVGETFIADTRKLSDGGLTLFAGVKEGRDGIEVLMKSQEKAEEFIARATGTFKDKELEVNLTMTSPAELDEFYASKMAEKKGMQEKVAGRSERMKDLAKGSSN